MVDTDEPSGRVENASRARFLAPGLALRISDLADTLGGYRASVVENDGHRIWIDLPIRRDGMLMLSIGQLVSLRFDRADDAAYLFDSVVADVRDDDDAPFGLAVPVTINRRPHRTDARLALVLDASFALDGNSSGADARSAKVVDLSGGGLGLICRDVLDIDSELTVRCDMPGPGDEVTLEHRAVVRSTSLYGQTPAGVRLFHYGLKFVDPDSSLRETILASVIWNLTRNPEAL